MADQTHSFTVHYTRQVSRRALNLFFRHRLQWTLVVVPATLLLFLCFYLWGTWTLFDQLVSLSIIVLCGVIAYVYFIRHRANDRFFRTTNDPSVHFEFAFDTVSVSSELGKSELKWKAFDEIIKSSDLWLLVYYRSGYLTLPTAQLSAECRAFIEERLRSSRKSA